MGTTCTFCDILNGDIAAHVVFENDDCMAFLDVRPLFEGHVLVVPRDHTETLMELHPKTIEPFFAATQVISQGVKVAMECDGIFIACNNGVSQSVAHLHVHVVPRRKKDGLRGFMWPRHKYESDEHATEVALRIRSNIS